MVKSIIGFALVCGAVAIDTTCEDDVVSALQQSALQHSSKIKQSRAHTVVYERLADVLKQASLGVSQVCLSVREGEEAPVAGVFSSDHGVMEVQRGYVAESSGRFCADAAVVSLLQRSMGAETVRGMEQALSKKSVDGTTKGKGKSPSPSPAPTPEAPSPTPEEPSPTPEPEPSPTPEAPSPTPAPSTTHQAPSPTPSGGGHGGGAAGASDYGALAKCSNPYVGIHCGGENTYGCTKAKIEKLCGSLANACCDDEDGSCADGDDHVKCIAAPHGGNGGGNGGGVAEAPAYGTLPMCGNQDVSRTICTGTNQYGCRKQSIIDSCGSVAKACCADEDGSCADGDDNVKCIVTPIPSVAWRAALATCNNPYPSIFCAGTNKYGCTDEADVVDRCGSLANACCDDQDGSCDDGDDNVKCIVDPHAGMNGNGGGGGGGAAVAADYGVLATCSNPYAGIHCGGVNTYGCTKAKIEEICGSLGNACCDDQDGSCADGDDNVKCIANPHVMGGNGGGVAEAPAYGTLPMCAGQELVKMTGGGTVICWGTNKYGCKQDHIIGVCGSVAKACCADEDGSCADGDDSVSCIKQ